MYSKTIKCALTIVCLLAAGPALALDLFSDARPQSTGRTCQSYAAALALAAKSDPAFPIQTFNQLRTVERKFRALAAKHGNPLSHASWDKAMEELTNNKYTFKRSYPTNDVVKWLETVKNKTRIDSDIGVLLAALSGSSVEMVLTSVYALGGSSYKSGHIVAAMGVIGSGIDSNTRLVAFNSAIKGAGSTGVVCDSGFSIGDAKYTAGVVDTNNFRLKGFPNFLVMQLVTK